MPRNRAPEGHSDSSAALRAFGLLELIAAAETPVTLEDLTQLSRLPKPTVHRLLDRLNRSGIVLREPQEKRYGIGPRLSALALSVHVNSSCRAERRAILAQLVKTTGETC